MLLLGMVVLTELFHLVATLKGRLGKIRDSGDNDNMVHNLWLYCPLLKVMRVCPSEECSPLALVRNVHRDIIIIEGFCIARSLEVELLHRGLTVVLRVERGGEGERSEA
ncbi:hypothetical protein E2542_SST06972 [Spatholobus suberectus]|nr:hypothetical protein E2542_SST06972 [Spatholobus suberectus]